MNVINESVIVRFLRTHPDSRSWLEAWLWTVREADWKSIGDVRQIYSSADGGVVVNSGANLTVFNVCGNKYRMITRIAYAMGTVAVLDLLTHAEYSKNHWKKRL